MNPQPASDEQWKRLRADIGRLVARRVPSPADIEDIVQEVLIRVWRHRSQLRDNERFGSWLSRVVYNAVADHFRSQSAQAFQAHEASEDDVAGVAFTPGDLPPAKVLIAAVLRPFVDQLEPPYREAVTLSELEGLSHAAIAKRLSLSVSGVKSRVQRGREQLKAMLERCCDFALDARRTPISCSVRPGGVVPPSCFATCAHGPDELSAAASAGCIARPQSKDN